MQLSWTSQIVPRTVAAEYLPDVRNAPLPLPHSLRDFVFLAARLALPAFGQPVSGSLSLRSVMPPFWVTTNMPP